MSLRGSAIKKKLLDREEVYDIVMGMSDGFAVPFAVAAGLSVIVNQPSIIVVAGLAGVAARSVSMTFGGYVTTPSPHQIGSEMYTGNIPSPEENKTRIERASRVALSYAVGGIVPLIPFLFMRSVGSAFLISAIITGIAFLFLGYAKGKYMGLNPVENAIRTLLVGGIAAISAFMIARLLVA